LAQRLAVSQGEFLVLVLVWQLADLEWPQQFHSQLLAPLSEDGQARL